MTKIKRSEESKQQIIKECDEVGNVALMARRHNISENRPIGVGFNLSAG